jgi:hypothetical protein
VQLISNGNPWDLPSRLIQYALAPGSGDVDIAAPARHPAAGNPHSSPSRRVDPAATHPHISASVPSIVPGNPNPSRMQRWSRPFNDNRRWWARMDNDLCICCAQAQTNPTNYDEDTFFHAHEVSDVSGTLRKSYTIVLPLEISTPRIPLLPLMEDSAIDIRPEFFSTEGASVEQDVGQPALSNLGPVLIG